MQSHLECRLWNEIFVDAQKALGIPNGGCGVEAQAPGHVLWKPSAALCGGHACACTAGSMRAHTPHPRPAPAGTIKATCLIETLPAAFEMDEFIYELRDHMAGAQLTAHAPFS